MGWFTYSFTILFISGLGHGWAPAVLNTEEELDFVKEAQKGVTHTRSYWIGGSTNVERPENFGYSSYESNESGKVMNSNFKNRCTSISGTIKYFRTTFSQI